ncbi:MAG TPA: hypothetical protein VK550_29975 [Polyangiaceae bacterium]|nr:hypothetical protein [Polyangiaceae bacterium]
MMTSNLVAIGSWAFMACVMLYGARHPERIVRARRSVASQHPVTAEERTIIRIILGATILICVSVGYTTGELALPLIGVPAVIALSIPLEIVHRRGFGFFARNQVPTRIVGLFPIGMGVREWFTGSHGMAAGLGALGFAFICLPRLMARASSLGMSEQQEIARTRTAGRIGGILASLAVLAMAYLTITSRLSP